MAVTIDQEKIDAAGKGFSTIGQVLAWAGREGRIVVQLLIDGEAPDLRRMDTVRPILLADRHVYVETADPGAMALDALSQSEKRLVDSTLVRDETVSLLRESKWTEAMAKLGVCLGDWLEAQQTAQAVAKMFGISLENIEAGSGSVAQLSGEFANQLRRIQTAIGDGDLVGLIDLLAYETEETTRRWKLAITQLKQRIGAGHAVRSAA
jgi:hypothetical protein